MTLLPGHPPAARRCSRPRASRSLPLFSSSRDSYTRPVQPVGVRDIGDEQAPARVRSRKHARPRVLAVAAEGELPGAAAGAPRMRAIIVGDGDFASNSFLPYLSNGDLAMAMVRWLVREERSTAVATRIPVPPMILLSGAQMKAIFLLVEVLLPLLVIALGAMVWWRRR